MNNALKHSLLALALIGAFGQAAAATAQYHIEIDSNSFTGLGFLDLQLNPGDANAASAHAVISGFQGLLDHTQGSEVYGAVSGNLPGNVSFANSDAYNDLFQGVTFGGKFSFNVSFSGDFLNGSGSSSAFAVSLYGADRVTALGNADAASGSLLRFDLGPVAQNGNISYTTFDGGRISVSAVPEPSQWLMMAGGLLALGAIARRRRQA